MNCKDLENRLGVWVDDPRSVAAVVAKHERAMETQRVMTQPVGETHMEPGIEYEVLIVLEASRNHKAAVEMMNA